ncbi:bifunctional diaminohydroxyphosphoribosylaminopyrimidine deaminase/5-amino-6-(5-phosphoribosylamino)uracil reductase RibD [Dinoroseobacter sp. S375]|uniref:bifunctional diaminohydroxyphosphoribosylaminopyrimidine deaminase/5-amino-6-(5-phosphoribosylamino)uracil reductase RibD n=1 Tax=Dinoroseobacter sp. S375 TaxID=3415136 RepID=UPI003C7D5DCB
MTADLRWMQVALTLGRRGMGRTWPNPAVGCVIVSPEGRVVGRGWTQLGGRPHAEVMALRQAGDAARGATAYVTLEPCAHHGKTGPCAEALSRAGIARVVSALQDPDPRVSGGGHDILRKGGIAVTEGVGADQARSDHEGFLIRATLGRPMLTLKLALTLDGRLATARGESQWITGPEARRAGHAMRARHDAVLIGAGTARADDPTLTVRDMGVAQQPVRIVAARGLDIPLPSRLSETASDAAPVWICHGEDAPAARIAAAEAHGLTCLETLEGPDGLDPEGLLQVLGAQGVTRVYCEGGGALGAALMRAGLVDRLAVFHAGCAIGADGRAGLGPMGLDRLAEAPRFDRVRSAVLGADVLTEWRRR